MVKFMNNIKLDLTCIPRLDHLQAPHLSTSDLTSIKHGTAVFLPNGGVATVSDRRSQTPPCRTHP